MINIFLVAKEPAVQAARRSDSCIPGSSAVLRGRGRGRVPDVLPRPLIAQPGVECK